MAPAPFDVQQVRYSSWPALSFVTMHVACFLCRPTFPRAGPCASWQRSLSDLGYDGFGEAVGGNELGPLAVQGRQTRPARRVDEGHVRQVNAEDRFALLADGVLPARLQLRQPRPCHTPLKLECKGLRIVVDRDS
jgi:hypothetical protein